MSNAKYTFAAEDAAYNVILTVGDRFRSVPITVFGHPALGKLFSFLKKSGSIAGIAIGKKAETEGVLDVGYKLLLSGGIYGEEEGDKDGWHYKKYSNGVAECWKTIEHSTALSTAWGGLYYGTATSRQTYPFTFVSKPVETVSLQAQTYQGIIFPEKDGYGVNTASATACYNICRPSSITTATKFYISFNVKGKWK